MNIFRKGKLCRACGEWKPYFCFFKQKTMKDGYRPRCKDCIKKAKASYYELNKERLKAKSRDYRRNNTAKVKATRNEANRKLKVEAFTHYGQGEIKCVRCGEKDIDVLCLDHINGLGTHLRKMGIQSVSIYWWTKRYNYPEGFQVLCANCNLKKRIREKC